jgi:hypothetical protein
MAKRKKLTEAEWAKVFAARCKSKQGQAVTPEERKLLDAAYETDPKRYGALDADVFDATVPFGSHARYKR